MHDIKNFEANYQDVVKNFARRNLDSKQVDQALLLNKTRKTLIAEVESAKADLNNLSREIGALKKSGQNADDLMAKVATIKKTSEEKSIKLETLKDELNLLLASIPNLLDEEVPAGRDEASNKIIKVWGEPTKHSFKVLDHSELGEKLGMLDFEAGAKLTGSRFVVYKGLIAKLERALINFFLDEHGKVGYQEIIPPFMVNAAAMYGTGQLPKFAEDAFKIEGRDWYLIPTSEVPVTNLKKDELFKKEELPFKYTAYSPCFRSEAGSYGKDTKGLIRLHQFNKVEIVQITSRETSRETHEQMIAQASLMLEKLKLPYRAVLLCGGDIGFGAQKCVDLEVWLPAQEKYREISSISNFGEFQARRAEIRYRNEQGKPEYAHTLNGSGLAVGRTVVAIMENYQNADGSITVPEVLLPYMNGIKVIKK
jgi:seryl-tRNA synthetase